MTEKRNMLLMGQAEVHHEIEMSHEEWMQAKLTADQRMKANNGHSFVTILKTRCQFCGRSRKAKGRCGQWFQTFLWHLDVILMNLEREREQWKEKA